MKLQSSSSYIYVAVVLLLQWQFLLAFQGWKSLHRAPQRKSLDATVLESPEVSSKLKVPSNAWRWPPAWPFPKDFLEAVETYESPGDGSELIGTFLSHTKAFIGDEDTVLVVGAKDGIEVDSLAGSVKEVCTISDNEVSSSIILPYSADTFDSVVFRSGVESLTDPTELFAEIWRVTKPGGKCFVCFASQPKMSATLTPVKMWQTMTDEQKIWITGSYFHYSTMGAWENIEGYDLLGSSGDGSLVFNQTASADSATTAAYVVQSEKISLPPLEADGMTNQNLTFALRRRLVGIKNLRKDDQKFVSYRLAAQYNASLADSARKTEILDNIQKLDSIYNVLKDVKEIVIPSPVKAMLATMMLDEWSGSADQDLALRRSLGIAPPDEQFWGPVGQATMDMAPKIKIYFLADLIPKFGQAPFEAKLASFPKLLKEAITICETKLPTDTSKASIQAFVTDVVVSDFLKLESGSPADNSERVLRYLKALSEGDLGAMVAAPTK
mmetsp:Transcript_12221/g.20270  ORF Transcript_12221/g.20270 Transcript_12221/m.20270 type:complete len:497 (+) Transcript_12221:105-1595(+)|eukprot:CAMPEP_0175027088 /NCGR_PEP_ID=MMETSP0005-20121125/18142_1 /TAXON_ID=420556 /ORGANISM="Ochromonas sp., Strain CCMP1393" /LENGTH=496 /DNA_ID=CAMNT_0016286341 /DNA_START=41 /DNA_END=1531 /DNA_ORIENTATION=+